MTRTQSPGTTVLREWTRTPSPQPRRGEEENGTPLSGPRGLEVCFDTSEEEDVDDGIGQAPSATESEPSIGGRTDSSDDSLDRRIASTLKAAAELLEKKRHGLRSFKSKDDSFADLRGGSSSDSTGGAYSEDSASSISGEEGKGSSEVKKIMRAYYAKLKNPFMDDDDSDDSHSIQREVSADDGNDGDKEKDILQCEIAASSNSAQKNPSLDDDDDGARNGCIELEGSSSSKAVQKNQFTAEATTEKNKWAFDSKLNNQLANLDGSGEGSTKKAVTGYTARVELDTEARVAERVFDGENAKELKTMEKKGRPKDDIRISASAAPRKQPSKSNWSSPRSVTESVQPQDKDDVIQPTGSIASSTYSPPASITSSVDSPPTPPSSNRQKQVNPFADLLALRRATKMATDKRLNQSVGSINLGASSSDTSSLNSYGQHSNDAGARRVFFYDDTNDGSLDGVIFSDLKMALSRIQSVEYEGETSEEEGDNAGGNTATGVQEGKENEEDARPDDMESQVFVRDESSLSGVISSLKDSTPEFYKETILRAESDFNDDPFEDDDDDVSSVPRSPAPLESSQVHLLGQEGSETSNGHGSSPQTYPGAESEAIAKAIENVRRSQTQGSNSDSDDTTEACSNAHKVDYLNERPRESTLNPPKKDVIINDNRRPGSGGSGSISTKTDSILGKTINVANADLIAERIYLESLRAQVLAELKVHAADEEIRHALDARLKAIRDYYKRKATVLHLKPAAAAETPPSPPPIPSGHGSGFLEKLGNLPQVRPTVARGRSDEDEQEACTATRETYRKQQQISNEYAFERVQEQIGEALQAAHNNPKQESVAASQATGRLEEEKAPEEEKEHPYDRQATETPIPLHIFTKDTFWDDEDDPSTIHVTASSPPPCNIVGINGIAGIIKQDPPATHAETMQNAWKFYRSVNTLIFDSRMYDYNFQLLQEDPLYPYLNSLMGIADGGMDGFANEHKRISQRIKTEYSETSPHRICHTLVEEAHGALEGLKEVCAYIGAKLGMQTMAVGPIKKPTDALLKCERKYGGDPLLVTDYCRASLFVKDVASLLALVEIVLSKYASIVRRIKLSTLKCNHNPLVGGYRDCKINLDIGGHICELQVHLIPMWLIKEGKGYSHYKSCCGHNVDNSSFDITKTLDGLDRQDMSNLIKVGEEVTTRTPIHQVQQYHENQIRDYFALANLYLQYGVADKTEYILRRIVKLRSESEDFGPCHAETLMHMELLRKSLKRHHKYKSASAVKNQIKTAKKMQRQHEFEEPEKSLSELCTKDQCGAMDYIFDMILDPNKKERQEETRKTDAVKESRALWLEERRSFFN